MNQAVKDWLDDLERQRFYGSATLKIEAGRVTYIREERGMRPEELVQSGNPRTDECNRRQHH